jgi:hypothetical protein
MREISIPQYYPNGNTSFTGDHFLSSIDAYPGLLLKADYSTRKASMKQCQRVMFDKMKITTKMILVLFVAFITINVLDILTTVVGLQLGATEINPSVRNLMEAFGILGAIFLKFAFVSCMGLTSLFTYRYAILHNPRYMTITNKFFFVCLLFGITAYVPIILNNVQVILELS